MTAFDSAGTALLALLGELRHRGYQFVTPTPATHARVVSRPERQTARTLRDVFGWSLPFARNDIDHKLVDLLEQAGAVAATGGKHKALVRVSSLGPYLFVHSAYPTTASDAVFFGPDSYRFADFLRAELHSCPPGTRIVDIGTGAGVGGIVAAGICAGAKVVMTDINAAALRLARINAAFANVDAAFVETDGVHDVAGAIDIAIANPPYIADAQARTYRDGGDLHGGQLSVDLARAAAARLAPGGRLLLYTGAAIVEGRNMLCEALTAAMRSESCTVRWREIDPDVFGEELARPNYRAVERIAVVGAVATKD